MRIVLINPYLDYLTQSFPNKTFQPLDLLNISALLRKKNFKDLEVIDANLYKIKPTDLFWKKINADWFVITSSSIDRWQCPINDTKPVIELIKTILENHKKSWLIVYGFDATTNSHHYNFSPRVYTISGEPEFKVTNLILKMAKKRQYKKTGIQELAIPAFDLADMGKYHYPLMGKNFSLVEFSRGCPYNCVFCSKIMYPKRYQTKTIEQMIAEIKYLKKAGINNLYFIDLEFCINQEKVRALCRELIKDQITINWAVQSRIDQVDENLLYLMKKAGCVLIHFGVESGSQRILDLSNKKITLSRIRSVFKITKKCGIKTLAYFMLGNLNETKADIIQTINFAKELNSDYASFVLVSNYSGSSFFQEKKICDLSQEQLEKLRRKAYIQFYLRPGYISKQIKCILNDPKEIIKIVCGFFSFFLPLIKKNG